MSLRKSPRLTTRLLAANRQNAQNSTGPRTSAGKERSRWNALKHGRYTASDATRESMLALGEDPEGFERLYQELLSAYEPADALWAKQVEDLAKLYWRRGRLERARAGLVRRELDRLEQEREQRRKEIEEAVFAPTERRVLDVDVPRPQDAAAKLRQALSYGEVIREQVAQRNFTSRLAWIFGRYCGENQTWRTNLIRALMNRLARDNEYSNPPREDDYPKLVELLEEEIGNIRAAFEAAERESPQISSAERDARLAPLGESWDRLSRQEAALDRAIDRKTKILLSYLRFGRRPARQAEGKAEGLEDVGEAGLLKLAKETK